MIFLKKTILILLSLIMILVPSFCFTAGATGNISGDRPVSSGYLYGNAITLTQQIPVQETVVTCNFPIDTSILVDSNGGSYNDYDIVVGRGYYDYGGSSSSWADFTQEIELSYNDTTNVMNYILPFNSLFDSQLEGRSFTSMLTVVEQRETIYINYSDLSNFLVNIGYGAQGLTLSAKQSQSLKLNWIAQTVDDSGKVVYKHENKTYTGTYASDLLALISEDFAAASDAGSPRSDIIGISYYHVTSTCTVESQENNSTEGYLGFSIKNTGTRRTAEEFTNQTPYGNIIGSDTVDIVYTDHLNIGSVITSIKNALDVNLFGNFSILDVISVIVGLSLAMWLLKVFAGG